MTLSQKLVETRQLFLALIRESGYEIIRQKQDTNCFIGIE